MSEETKAAKNPVKKSNKKIVLTAVVVIVLVIVVIIVALKQVKARQLEQQLDLAAKYLSMMEYERAMDAYLDAIEIEPECVEAYFGLTVVYYETGEAEKAEAVMRQVESDANEVFDVWSSIDNTVVIGGLKDESMKVVVIPKEINGRSVAKIGQYAFRGCRNLIYIIISDGVTEIGEDAFEDCESLTNVIIPDSITEIGESAFCGCKSLTSVDIPDGVTKIRWNTFWTCESLTSVTIPNGITEIDQGAFGCTNLTSVMIPDGVTEIGYHAFAYCGSLTSVMIPDSVTKITYAFESCDSLKTIHTPQGSYAEQWALENGYEVVNTIP